MTDELSANVPLDLDPLAKFVGEVTVGGVTYRVRSITGKALRLARKLADRTVPPDMLLDAVASVVPEVPVDVLEGLDVEQLGRILRVATAGVAKVEAAAAPKE